MTPAILNACHCGGKLYFNGIVRFGYRLKCERCESETEDAGYSTLAFCSECGVVVHCDDPDDDLTCEECSR